MTFVILLEPVWVRWAHQVMIVSLFVVHTHYVFVCVCTYAHMYCMSPYVHTHGFLCVCVCVCLQVHQHVDHDLTCYVGCHLVWGCLWLGQCGNVPTTLWVVVLLVNTIFPIFINRKLRQYKIIINVMYWELCCSPVQPPLLSRMGPLNSSSVVTAQREDHLESKLLALLCRNVLLLL